ncbi:hypothetical protein [Anaerorhabdus furcosa]|uniref:DUF4367 domain-containing protein n=1 Tax=Anaerorhabdus furcosa TaxID=118967 RepID=A0A1T4LAR6_9FIRM|nr:hypothetical protein [Anaerorhabdus furcosa]SJZ51786.1 hypothetical protein SAMN02745191_0814 [Anaerorhabdus furcosa]
MKTIILFILSFLLFIGLSGCKQKDEFNYNQLSVANPYESVESSDAFKDDLDIVISAPIGATNITYYIINKKVAQIDFLLNDVFYTYRASKSVSSMLHGNYETVKKYEQFFIENNIEVNINTTESDKKVVTWEYKNINYSLTAESPVNNEDLLSFVQNSLN